MNQKIEDRIQELQECLDEEEKHINLKSYSTFKTLLELLDPSILKDLIITLTPDNDIYINYESDKRYCILIRGEEMRLFTVRLLNE